MTNDEERHRSHGLIISVIGLGVAVMACIAAYLALMPEDSRWPFAKGGTGTIARFEVLATVPKNRTGISVSRGDVMHFEYLDGQWTGKKTEPGLTTGCGYTFHDPVEEHIWLLPPEQRGNALVGYVDNNPFWIGCNPVDIMAMASGELYLGMSDCQDCFGDNEGALFVRVSVGKK